jgi:NitT/TauT family transport system permease protein
MEQMPEIGQVELNGDGLLERDAGSSVSPASSSAARSTATPKPAPLGGDTIRDRVLPLVGVAVFLALWWLGVALSPGTPLPGPVTVLRALVALASDGTLAEHIFASLHRVVLGYLAAVVVAIPLGLALGWWKRPARALNPLIEVFRPISPLAWIPIAILWFGVDDATAVFLIFIATCLPVVMATMSAVHHIPAVHLRAGRNFGLRGFSLMRYVIYPCVMPRLIVGLRVALGISWLVVVAAEMISVRSGLGFLIIDSRNAGNRYDLVVAGMVAIGVIGLLLDLGMREFEKLRSVRWAYQGGSGGGRPRVAMRSRRA